MSADKEVDPEWKQKMDQAKTKDRKVRIECRPVDRKIGSRPDVVLD